MLQLNHISKSFPGVQALSGVSLEFRAGEVHALCGENGAGKSTLMNIITGNIQPDKGEILWNNSSTIVKSVAHARNLGIGIVYQERTLVGSLSVAENIFINPPLSKFGLISYSLLYMQTQHLLDELRLTSISPEMVVDKLTAAQKQLVEIARALAQNPSLLILDEPTASLTHEDTAVLFNIIQRLKTKKVAVIYISHRMDEIKEIADVVSILKDGGLQGSFNSGTISTEEIINRMVGRAVRQLEYHSHKSNRVVLEAKNFSGKGFQQISFSLHEGEILGFAGLAGSGRTLLALTIFGDRLKRSGELYINGKPFEAADPSSAIKNKIAYIPDERKALGLFMEKSISDNITSADKRSGFFSRQKNDAVGEAAKLKLDIRATSVRQTVDKLSGGNQQKVVMAKWLQTDPEILIINEPTHGVDAGAKEDLYKELKKLTAAGKSILLVSSELTELLLLSDRIAVMYNGSIKDIVNHEDATEELIARLATGM